MNLKFELLAFAICMAVAFGGEFLLRALVGDDWRWLPWLALVTAAQVLVMAIPDRHYADFAPGWTGTAGRLDD